MNLDINNSKDLRCEVLSFKSEKLEIDYITLNISIEGHIDPKGIGEFLFAYGFNSKVLEHENDKGEKLFFNNKTKYEVILVKSHWNPQENYFWNGIAARFAGSNGREFYALLKQNKIKMKVFQEQGIAVRLSRFDLCYNLHSLESKDYKRSSINDFFQSCKKKYLVKYPLKRVTVKIPEKGLILRAGNRKNQAQYFRIYEKLQYLRFELEMRRKAIGLYQNSFFSSSFEEFEGELVQFFYNKFSDLCVFDSKYSYWLLKGLRKKSSVKRLADLKLGESKGIVSPYNLKFTEDLETSFQMLQLISFFQTEKVNINL